MSGRKVALKKKKKIREISEGLLDCNRFRFRINIK